MSHIIKKYRISFIFTLFLSFLISSVENLAIGSDNPSGKSSQGRKKVSKEQKKEQDEEKEQKDYSSLSLGKLQHEPRMWRKSLNIKFNRKDYNFISWFEITKALLDNLQQNLSSIVEGRYAAQTNICFGKLSFIIKVKGRRGYILHHFNLPSIYLSGVAKLKNETWAYRWTDEEDEEDFSIKNVLITRGMANQPESWIKGNRRLIFEAQKGAIKDLTHLNIKGGSEHAESCMVLDLPSLLDKYIQEIRDHTKKSFTIKGTIFNVLTAMDSCGMGCMPMFLKLPEIITEQLDKSLYRINSPFITLAPKLSNTVLIAGVKAFRDTRKGLSESSKITGPVNISLDSPKSQVFVSTYEDAIDPKNKTGSISIKE